MLLNRPLWVAILASKLALAQQASTTAVCNSTFSWMQNSRGQSPCLIAAFLQGACGSGAWTVPFLPFTADGQPQAYLAPNATSASLCTCSTAVYNLMSACAACQGGAWLLFAPWALTCDSARLLTLPLDFPTNIPVPSNTAIPQYAATDPRAWSSGGFNLTEAHQIALGGPAPGSYSSTTPAHSATETFSSSTTPSYSPQPASQGDTGVIVGGVVGGILGLSLVAVILVWLLCGQSIRKRFGKNTAQPKGEVLGRAFDTPTGAPPLANIVVPIPVRPYPVRSTFDSYMSSTSAGSNAGDYPGSATGHKEMTGPDGLARSDVGIMERGSSQNHRSLARNNTNSSFAASLIQRVSSSMRWRRRTQTNSMGSIGTGTVITITATGMDSDTEHGPRNVSGQNTARRNVDPIPFILPSHPEETAVVDISAEGVDRTSPYGMSAAAEKRRLNPPAYRDSVPWTNGNSRSDPGASNSLDFSSGGATAGSEAHHSAVAPVPPSTITLGTAMGRTSLPSNIVLPSPFDLLSQDASSGVLDSSPIHVRPAAADLRFTVTNPSVEM